MFEQNDLLNEITEQLGCKEPCYESATELLRESMRFRRNQGELPGILAEYITRANLEDICSLYGDRVVFDPVQPVLRSSWSFIYRDNLVVFKEQGLYPFTEYDQVLLIDKLPVVIEVKTGCGMKINSILEIGRLEHWLQPLKDYFESRLGMVMVLPKDFTRMKSKAMDRFIKNKGIVVPFYSDSEGYRRGMEKSEIVHRI